MGLRGPHAPQNGHVSSVRMQPGLPRKPAGLPEHASRVWDETIAELADVPGLLCPADAAALMLYCCAWQRWYECRDVVDSHGVVTESTTGSMRANPALIQQQCWMQRIIQAGNQFGLSPAARAAFTPVAKTKTDELTDLIT